MIRLNQYRVGIYRVFFSQLITNHAYAQVHSRQLTQVVYLKKLFASKIYNTLDQMLPTHYIHVIALNSVPSSYDPMNPFSEDNKAYLLSGHHREESWQEIHPEDPTWTVIIYAPGKLYSLHFTCILA